MDMEYEYLDEICDCGEKKRIQDAMCNKCQKHTIEQFRKVMKENFDKEQMEYLDSILDGEWITEFVLGKENVKC